MDPFQQQQLRRYQTNPSNVQQNNGDMSRYNSLPAHNYRASGLGGDFMMPYTFDDPLGPSLFGPSGIMPPSFLDLSMNRHHRHRQQHQLAGFDDFGGQLMRPFDMMESMVSSMGGQNGLSNGCYSSQVMMMSSTTGPDGRQHVERYAKSSAGNTNHKIRETKEAYSNSASGIDKLSWERQLDAKARRVLKERNRDTGEVISNDEIAGMNRDDECERFDSDWNRVAEEHLPIRARLSHHHSLSGQLSQQITTGGETSQQARRQQPRQLEAEDVTYEEAERNQARRRNNNHRYR